MVSKDKLIFIIEDERDFAESLKEMIVAEGYSVKIFADASSCIQQHKLNPPDLMLVDCMLPQMPGVEMVQTIHKEDSQTPVIFMSGIFTDKNFIKNAITSTNAIGFFTKPFDSKKLMETINENLVEEKISNNPLERIYQKSNFSVNELEAYISEAKTLHSYHLIKVIYHLAKLRWTGILELKEESETSSLSCHKGKIVDVKIKDPNSYFGRLLVAKNFLEPEELETVLATPSKKRIGEKLIEANLISPHIIHVINAEQMCLRMGLLFQDKSYDITLKAEEEEKNESFVDISLLSDYCIEWIITKFDTKWLQTFYMSLINSPLLIKDPSNSVFKKLKTNPSMSIMDTFFSELQTGKTLSDLLETNPNLQDKVYLAIHILATCSYIHFDIGITNEDHAKKLNRIKDILANTEKQDYFQILGIDKKAKVAQIKRSFHDLAKIFHPDTVSSNAPKEYKEAIEKLFAKITLAYETLSDPTKREKYLKEVQTGEATTRLKVENLFEEAKEFLKARKYQDALAKFDFIFELFPPTSDIKLHWLWARIQSIKNSSDPAKELNDINSELNKIPPEDRHTSIYYFVKGIFQKSLGEKKLAIGNLKHALSIDASFIEAKRELNILQLSEKNKPIDLLNADLKDVVGHIFNKVKR